MSKENHFWGFCAQKSHEELPLKFLCLADNCKDSPVLCASCVLQLHSDHKITRFKDFASKIPPLFSETRAKLSKLLTQLEKGLENSVRIQAICEDIKRMLANVSEKAKIEKKYIEQTLNKAKKAFVDISGFNSGFFDVFRGKKETPKEDIFSRICEIRNKLLLSPSFDRDFCLIEAPFFEEQHFLSKLLEISTKFQEELVDSLGSTQDMSNKTSKHQYKITQIRRFELKRNYLVKNLVLMPNSYYVASGHDNYLRHFKISSSEAVNIKSIDAHKAWIRSMSNHNELLASGSDDSTLKIWKFNKSNDLEQVQMIVPPENKGYFWSLRFLSNGMIAAGRGQNDSFAIRVWDYEGTGKAVVCYGHLNIVRSLVGIENNKKLVSASEDGNLKIWSLYDYKLSKTVPAHRNGVICMAHNEKLSLLATFGVDSMLKFWCLKGVYKCYKNVLLAEKVNVLLNFEKLELLVSGSDIGCLSLWDWVEGRIISNVFIGNEIHCVLCNEQEDSIINSDSSGKITVWQIDQIKK